MGDEEYGYKVDIKVATATTYRCVQRARVRPPRRPEQLLLINTQVATTAAATITAYTTVDSSGTVRGR